MKQYLKIYLLITFSLLFFTFFSSLILTILEKNEIIKANVGNIISYSFSYLVLAISSYILGVKTRKKGLINALLFSFIVIAISFSIGNSLSDITSIIKIVSKVVVILFFTVLGVNKKNS